MAKLDDLIQQKQQRDEDWKAKKTAEREELRQLSDDAVMRVTSEPNAYLRYLDTQAINPQYSAANVMLAMAQNPDITYINSLENWGRLGRSVNREETGLKIRVSDPYVKDGRQRKRQILIPFTGNFAGADCRQGRKRSGAAKGGGEFAGQRIRADELGHSCFGCGGGMGEKNQPDGADPKGDGAENPLSGMR